MKRCIASLLCVLLLAPGCAASRTPRVQTAPQAPVKVADREVLAEFAGQLRIGSRVKATVTGHRTVRGTLVKRTDQALVIQPRGRVAEPLIEVPFDELIALEQEATSSGGNARAVAIGAGVGAGAALRSTLHTRSGVLGRLISRQSSVGRRPSQSSVPSRQSLVPVDTPESTVS